MTRAELDEILTSHRTAAVLRPLSRAEMKALPVAQLIDPRCRSKGDLTLLHFPWLTRRIHLLYVYLVKQRNACRAESDPVRAFMGQRQLRRIWVALVNRSDGYWLLGVRELQRYVDA